MKIKRIIVVLISLIYIFNSQVYSWENENGYPSSVPPSGQDGGSSGGGGSDDSQSPDDPPENPPDNGGGDNGDGDSGDSGGSGGGGSGGDSGGSGEDEKDKVQKEVSNEADKIDGDLTALEKDDDAISGSEIPEEEKEEVEKEVQDILDKTETEAEAKENATEENVDLMNDMENMQNSLTGGDPVRLSEGCYEQNETDLSIGIIPVVEIRRNYNSQSKVTASFGYGWSSNLDERILLGTDANVEELRELYRQCAKNLSAEISKLKTALETSYNVSNLSSAKDELMQRIEECDRILAKAEKALESLNKLEKKASNMPSKIKSRIKNLQSKTEERKRSITEKRNQLQLTYDCIDRDLLLIDKLKEKQKYASQKQKEYQKKTESLQTCRQRNSKALFAGMGPEFVENGFDTINLIDEYGLPHLFYQSKEDEHVWNSKTEKRYLNCKSLNDSFILYEADGSEKEFDAFGFIIKIKDRNGNTISIRRNQEEKIEYIETSSNEHIRFEYENGFIKKITNLRDVTQNTLYEYQNNKLQSVTDCDGDKVLMEYNNDNRMIKLKKQDGSYIGFEYGENDARGKLLVTKTINEEGQEERFEYFKGQKRTDYIDHDGNRFSYWYDEKFRTIKELHPDGSVINRIYNDDNTLRIYSENNNQIIYTYDERGNKIHASYQDGSSENWQYDNYNFVTQFTDRDGVIYQYLRDEKGNLLSQINGGNKIFTQTFDGRGLVSSKTVYGEEEMLTIYEYDAYGNLKSESRDSLQTEADYDGRGRLIKKSLGGKILFEYKYSKGKIERLDYNGLKTEWYKNNRKDITLIQRTDSLTGAIQTTRVEYDKRHLPLRLYEGDGQTEKLTVSYFYTAEGKLCAEILHGSESWTRLYNYENTLIKEISQFKTDEDLSVADINQLRKLLLSGSDKVFTQIIKYTYHNQNEKTVSVTTGNESTVMFEFDASGNLIKTTDGNNLQRQKNYTRAGRLLREQGQYGGWYEYAYSKSGLRNKAGEKDSAFVSADYYSDGSLKSLTDRNGKKTLYHYDKKARLVKLQTANQKIWYEYDDLDRITKQVIGDSPDISTCVYYLTYDYSSDGRSVTATEGGKYKKKYTFDAFGNVLSLDDGNMHQAFVYDYQNNLIEAYDGYSNKTEYKYNALGFVSNIILPDGAETVYKYNQTGDLEQIKDNCGIIYEAEYDAACRLVRERQRGDVSKSYEYDKGGRIIKTFTGDALSEAYSYEKMGTELTVTDGRNEQYLYEYDSFGRLQKEKNRKALSQEYYYDADGQLKSKVNFSDEILYVSYSEDQTVQTISYSDGLEAMFTYDALGNILEASNQYGRTFYKYDQGGRLVYQKDKGSGEEITYDYDDAGNRIRLCSQNRETIYSYGSNNEVKEIFDNKQRVSIKLEYDVNGREVMRRFGNGTRQKTHYDKSGRIIVRSQLTGDGKLLWGEGYVYASDGKRTASIDNAGRVTFYEYNKQGQVSSVYYPPTEAMLTEIKKEALVNGLAAASSSPEIENRFLKVAEKSELLPLMNLMQSGLAFNLSNLQNCIKVSYEYDENGNLKSKLTSFGKIEYCYDKENCLTGSGSHGQTFVNYSYDKMGNLLTEKMAEKTIKYAYNSQNRLIYCEVIDEAEKTYSQTTYAYDAFGRRILVQDKDDAALLTVYDGMTFDFVTQGPVIASGLFTDSAENGLRWGKTGRPTGDRYRYISEDASGEDSRSVQLQNDSYKTVNRRYRGERLAFSVNGSLAAQTTAEGTQYFSTDLLGSVTSMTDEQCNLKHSYSYDVFGSPLEETFAGACDFGYLGKQFDPTSRLYNYGYRDYSPKTARFTTIDPIRDGPNWFAYCNGDPVNFIDFWGLCPVSDNTKPSGANYDSLMKLREPLNGTAAEFADKMKSIVGTDYVYGGNSPEDGGMDCSGSIIYELNQMGNDIPDMYARDIYKMTDPVVGQPQKGDLRFLKDKNGKIYHVQTIVDSDGTRVNATGDENNTRDKPGKIKLLEGPLPASGEVRRLRFKK